jgi:hypothetical protein
MQEIDSAEMERVEGGIIVFLAVGLWALVVGVGVGGLLRSF